ncbi:alpha/beta fold hydrolase [Arthrobacter globiformis]|nr:alpha/beta fold hydrolase [Arthrobacter globiformis]
MSVRLAYDSRIINQSGRALLFLGALGAHREMWTPQVDAFTALGINWIRADIRGLGDSEVVPGPYTMGGLADDVISLLDDLDIATADLVGLSLGGAVAQQLALQAPERVATLTLISTTTRFGDKAAWIERAANIRAEGTTGLGAGIAGRWFTVDYGRQNPDVLLRAQRWVTDTVPEGYASCAEALAEWDSSENIAAISAPTLVIGGASDPGIPPSTLKSLANGIGGATLVVIDPGAHLVNVEQPQTVTGLIAGHIGRLTATPNRTRICSPTQAGL